MDHVEAPALLAYRSGDVFATIVDIFQQLPRGRDCSADSLEDLLKLYVILLLSSFLTIRLTGYMSLTETEYYKKSSRPKKLDRGA